MSNSTVLSARTLALAHHMADAAGHILQRYWRSSNLVDRKSDLSPVTLADREVEKALRAMVEDNCPDHGIIGEEFGSLREDAALQWVIDPIDGTRSFIAGYPIFATLIALVENGTPILGIIDQPISGERWVGARGEETTRNGRPVNVRDCRVLPIALAATTSVGYFNPKEQKSFDTLKEKCGNVTYGGDAYAYAMLASGHIDIVIDAATKPYDFCALAPVIEGAGGVITDWRGKPLKLNSDGHILAAGNKELHEQALELLS